MSLETIRQAVANMLAEVDGIGVIHQYQRFAAEAPAFLAFFQPVPDGPINGWVITRVRTVTETASSTHEVRRHDFAIRGYYGLQDASASELTFQALVESICAKFREDQTLEGTAQFSEPVQVELVDLRMFGGVLCHVAELKLTAEEFEVWN